MTKKHSLLARKSGKPVYQSVKSFDQSSWSHMQQKSEGLGSSPILSQRKILGSGLRDPRDQIQFHHSLALGSYNLTSQSLSFFLSSHIGIVRIKKDI